MEKIKVEIDLIKTEVEIVRQKLLVFLGIGAGSFFYLVEIAKIYTGLLLPLIVVLVTLFSYSSFGVIFNLITLSNSRKEIRKLKEELKNANRS